MSEIKLPEPTSEHYYWEGDPPQRAYYYTAEQVRQAIAQERERCARVCETLNHGAFGPPAFLRGVETGSIGCAAAIRRG